LYINHAVGAVPNSGFRKISKHLLHHRTQIQVKQCSVELYNEDMSQRMGTQKGSLPLFGGQRGFPRITHLCSES
jgi:hypothetical protein